MYSGVAIGSTVGNMLGNGISSLWGGSGEAAAPTQATQAQAAPANSSWGNNCAGATEQFTKCMDDQGGNMQICGWYLEQLVRFSSLFTRVGGLVWDMVLTMQLQKACQAAASQY